MSVERQKQIREHELKQYLEESRGLERDYLSELCRSRRTAWHVAWAFGTIAVGGVLAGAAGLYKEAPPPLVLRVDNATGAVEAVSAMRVREQSYGEVVDQYWINQYVLNRESYDYNTIQMNY